MNNVNNNEELELKVNVEDKEVSIVKKGGLQNKDMILISTFLCLCTVVGICHMKNKKDIKLAEIEKEIRLAEINKGEY